MTWFTVDATHLVPSRSPQGHRSPSLRRLGLEPWQAQLVCDLPEPAVERRPLDATGGQVVVSVSSRQFAGLARPHHRHSTVTDSGPGMPEDLRQRVFEKFLRLEGPRVPGHTAIQGAGLGLSRCRQIVEAHGGAIWCEAGDRGRGTRLLIELRVAPPGR